MNAAKLWKTLYATCTDPAATFEGIDAQLLPALAPLTVAQLRAVAVECGVTLCDRTKARIVSALKNRIWERKWSNDRNKFRP